MNTDLVQEALAAGFSNAALVATEQIPFEPAFLACCEENLCGQYGKNYACPPDCGTPAQMQARLQRYKNALVLQTTWQIDDPMDQAATKKAKGEHNRMVRRLIDSQGRPGLMVGASGCNLCKPCLLGEGLPCRFPPLQFSCMSAYCVFVQQLAEQCGMEYDSGPGLVSFFGLFAFD